MDTISGGYIAADGVINLTVGVGLTGYVILPNKTVLTTVARVLNGTNTGIAGFVTYYVPKNSDVVDISESELEGEITYNGVNEFKSNDCPTITGLNAINAGSVQIYGSPLLTNLVADNSYLCYAGLSSLSAKSIATLLARSVEMNKLSVNFDFQGGNNALQGAVDSYLQVNFAGISYATVYGILVTANGGTILIDTV